MTSSDETPGQPSAGGRLHIGIGEPGGEQRMLATLLSNLPGMVYRCTNDPEWTMQFVSEGCQTLTGYPAESLLWNARLSYSDIVHPDDRAMVWEKVQEALRKQERYEILYRIRTADGAVKWVWEQGQGIFEHGVPAALEGFITDISHRVRAEEALRESEEKFRLIVENAFDGISIFEEHQDPDQRRLITCNARYAELAGRSREELLALGNTRNLARPLTQDNSASIEQGAVFHGAFTWLRPDGKDNIIEYTAVPIQLGGKKYTIGIDRDVTEQRHAEIALRRAHEELEVVNQELEKASVVKSRFLANMSHEIRTPLNAIIGMTGLLLDTPQNAEQGEFTQTIRASGEVLLALVNDILDLSKIEAEKLELEHQPFEVHRCIEEALDLLTPRAADKHLELAYSIDEGLPARVVGDVTRLRQVLINLLANAVKFTEHGEVEVSTSGQLRDHYKFQLHFTVRDTGVGIPAEHQPQLFQSFSQLDASTTRKYGGTGLGLAISKRLCGLMGGTMWVESTGVPGEGSTFHFTILVDLSIEDQAISTTRGLTGLRVLIVDDNKTNRDILRRQTTAWLMEPEVAGSGPEALERLRQGPPVDLTILDLQMPEMDGLMLADEIRKLLGAATPPLVLLSSLGYREMESRHPRFAASLTKPVKPSQLHDALCTVLNRTQPKPAAEPSAAAMKFDAEIGRRHPLRILLAEDNEFNQKVAIRSLQKIGYEPDLASNGREALEAMRRRVYDVILMDGQMPEMDGEEATREIRRSWSRETQPRIIALTANAMESDRERYLATGMDDYLAKPIRLADLVRALLESPALTDRPA